MIEYTAAACRRVEQVLSALSDRYKGQAEAADRLDRSSTRFLTILGGVVVLSLTGICCLLLFLP